MNDRTKGMTVAERFENLAVSTIHHDSHIEELRAALFDRDLKRAYHWADAIVADATRIRDDLNEALTR